MFEKVLIIAEAGSNHNGDLGIAIELVRTAGEAGADAIKFQSFTLSSLFSPSHYEKALGLNDPGWKEAVVRCSFKPEWHADIAEAARKARIAYFATPFSPEAVDILDEYVPFYKVASGDITYIPLLKKIAEKHKGVFISTGASRLAEIDRAVRVLEPYRLPFICIMHCVMLYPPGHHLLHLNFIDTLKLRYSYPVGFSDHTTGMDAALVAVGKGIRALEKHFTLNKHQEGHDHQNSLEPDELHQLVERVRRCESMLGRAERPIYSNEARERVYARRGIYAGEDLKRGEKITIDRLHFLRPNTAIGAEEVDRVLGRVLSRDVASGTPLDYTMFEPHI